VSLYATMHTALMYALLGVFWLLVGYLVAAGVVTFVRAIQGAPDGKEDGKGFHQR